MTCSYSSCLLFYYSFFPNSINIVSALAVVRSLDYAVFSQGAILLRKPLSWLQEVTTQELTNLCEIFMEAIMKNQGCLEILLQAGKKTFLNLEMKPCNKTISNRDGLNNLSRLEVSIVFPVLVYKVPLSFFYLYGIIEFLAS